MKKGNAIKLVCDVTHRFGGKQLYLKTSTTPKRKKKKHFFCNKLKFMVSKADHKFQYTKKESRSKV